ncbi:hypothetical protein JCM3770_004694 [Rhodotorula araucariae]
MSTSAQSAPTPPERGPVSSAGAHGLTPPSSSVTYAPSNAGAIAREKVHGALEVLVGKLGGDKRRQGTGLRKEDGA